MLGIDLSGFEAWGVISTGGRKGRAELLDPWAPFDRWSCDPLHCALPANVGSEQSIVVPCDGVP